MFLFLFRDRYFGDGDTDQRAVLHDGRAIIWTLLVAISLGVTKCGVKKGACFFLIWGDKRSLRMPAPRPASQAGPMRNPREGTSAVLRDTVRLT